MKKTFNFLLFVCLVLASYGQEKTYKELPCTIYDNEEYLTGIGIAYGLKDSIASLKTLALINAQTEIHFKMEHTFKGVTEMYLNQSDNAMPESKIITAGNHIINIQVGESELICLRFSDVDKDGKISCVLAIRVKKQRQTAEESKNKSKFDKENFKKFLEEEFGKNE